MGFKYKCEMVAKVPLLKGEAIPTAVGREGGFTPLPAKAVLPSRGD